MNGGASVSLDQGETWFQTRLAKKLRLGYKRFVDRRVGQCRSATRAAIGRETGRRSMRSPWASRSPPLFKLFLVKAENSTRE